MATHTPALRNLLQFFAAILLLGQLLPHGAAFAQARRDISVLVAQVKAGAQDEVGKLLPALKKSHPDKAGVLFLEALMESNAERSVELYQRVADEFGKSEWADDALYRLYQYSYAVGAYKTAHSYTERIAKEYPQSPFLSREQRAAANQASATKNQTSASKNQTSASKNSASGKSSETAKAPSAKAPASKAPASKAPAPETPAATSGGSYAVQIGAYSRETDAQKQIDEMKTKGYTAYLREKKSGGKTVQAVWLGIFSDFAQAQAFASKLKQQQNMDAIVVRR